MQEDTLLRPERRRRQTDGPEHSAGRDRPARRPPRRLGRHVPPPGAGLVAATHPVDAGPRPDRADATVRAGRPGTWSAGRTRRPLPGGPPRPPRAARRPSSGWSARTTSPPCSSPRSSRYSAVQAASASSSSSVHAVMSHSSPACPNRAVRQRKPSEACRPVVCARGGPTCAPTSSGGSSRPVQRWIGLTLEGVVGVRRPHPVGVLEDAEVDPRAAGRARLDLQRRVPRAQRVEQRVGRERLRVHTGRARRATGLVQVAVVVPLEVVDADVADAARRAARAGRPQASGRARSSTCWRRDRPWRAPGRGQQPVGVLPGQVGVGVDHLRLDPEAELHPEPAHVVGQRAQAVRPHRRVDDPVTQAGACRRAVRGTSRRPARSARRRPARPTSASAVSRSRSWSK